MKKVKIARAVSLLLAAAMVSALVAGCGGKGEAKAVVADEKVAKTGYPIVPEPITLSIFCAKPDGTPADFNTIPFFERYAKQTNININWQLSDYEAFNEKLNIIIATDDLPDAIMKGYIPDVEVVKQVKNGTYLNTSPLLAEYAPNFNAYVEKDESLKKALTIGDGIYGFPYLCEADSIRTRKAYINKKWMDAVDAKMPTTTDELLDVLRLFRDKDPNGNGVADEIPFGGESIDSMLTLAYGSFGLMNRGMPNGQNDFVDEDPENPGQIRFFRAAPQMKEVLQYVNTLYKEKLIDPNIYSIKPAEFYAYAAQNKVGFHPTLPSLVGPEYTDDFIALDAPLKGPHGDQIWNNVLGRAFTKSCFLLTKSNKNPAATLRWVDYFYTAQGAVDYLLGEEGITYTKTGDGKYEVTDYVNKNPDGKSVGDAIGQYSIYSGGANPTLLTNDNFKGPEMYKTSFDATEKFLQYAPKPLWETFVFTPEQATKITQLQPDIKTMMKENEAKFITGERSLDEWDKYVSELKSIGLDDYVKAYQDVYVNYSK